MIRHADEMPTVRIPNMLGGKLYVDGQRFLEADESMGAGAFFGRATMPPGGSFGFHIQKCRCLLYTSAKALLKDDIYPAKY